MFDKKNLQNSLIALGVSSPSNIFPQLAAAYNESTRYYHTAQHISECLKRFADYRENAEYPAEVEVAIWFHDAVYDTTKSDNEEKSAEWARHYLTENAVDPQCVERIVQMIIATKTHQPISADSALMVDIDLGILGASSAAFDQYDAAIRKEFHWVPTIHYCLERSRVLLSFLKRETIYQTAAMQALYEAQARVNLSRRITELAIK